MGGTLLSEGLPEKAESEYDASRFPTVEINATFYLLPSLPMVRRWHDQAPGDFVFAVKGSRFLTPIERLKDTGVGLRKYFSRLKPLAERTGPILWQLPANFRTRRLADHPRRGSRLVVRVAPRPKAQPAGAPQTYPVFPYAAAVPPLPPPVEPGAGLSSSDGVSSTSVEVNGLSSGASAPSASVWDSTSASASPSKTASP